MSQRPLTVRVATWLLWLLIAGGLVVSILVVVFRSDLDAVWSPISAGDSTVQPTDFVPVILVLYVVIAVTMMVMITLFHGRHLWAQHGLAVIALGILLGALGMMRTESPMMVRLAAVAAGVVAAVAVVFLWHPETTRYIRGARARDADS